MAHRPGSNFFGVSGSSQPNLGTSKLEGLKPSSLTIAFVERPGSSCDFFGHTQFRAAGTRVFTLFLFARLDRLWRDQLQIVFRIASRFGPFRAIEPFTAEIAEEIFDDPVF